LLEKENTKCSVKDKCEPRILQNITVCGGIGGGDSYFCGATGRFCDGDGDTALKFVHFTESSCQSPVSREKKRMTIRHFARRSGSAEATLVFAARGGGNDVITTLVCCIGSLPDARESKRQILDAELTAE
jgi:hypothetical protein